MRVYDENEDSRGENSIADVENDIKRPRTSCSLTMDMSASFVPLGLYKHTTTRSMTFHLVKTEKRLVAELRGRVPLEKNYDRTRVFTVSYTTFMIYHTLERNFEDKSIVEIEHDA